VPGIGIVINPHARHNRGAADRVELFAEMHGRSGWVRRTASLDELDAAVAEFRQRGIDVLAVCGGDGSFFRALSAMVRCYGPEPLPYFLPLRGGSMNTVARSVDWARGTPEAALAQAVADYRAGRGFALTDRHLVGVDGRYFGFMVAAGSIVAFLSRYYDSPGRGPWAAAKLVTRVAVSGLVGSPLARGIFRHTEARITCDGEPLPHGRFTIIYASSITDIGLGFKPTYLATRKRGFFHVLAGPVRAPQVVRRLRRLRHGRPLGIETLYDNLAQHLRVEFSRPTQYMIDGDIFGAATVLDVVTGPRLTIICK